MDTTILQVPIKKDARQKATVAAREMGFSSLQEAVRVFLNKLAVGEMNIRFEETIQLSPGAAKRYDKILDDIEKGKNLYEAKDVDDLMRQLNED